MRHFGLLLLAICPAAAFAQTPENDQRVLQALLSEVQQLRVAIERQTLLGTRTQIAISQLQLQEGRAGTAAKELASVHDEAVRMKETRSRWTEELKDLEQKRLLGTAMPQVQNAIENQAKELKLQLEVTRTREEQLMTREGELMSLAQAAQRDVQESRSRIAEMERVLDAAIQQMLKK
jgi:hypothetical protein